MTHLRTDPFSIAGRNRPPWMRGPVASFTRAALAGAGLAVGVATALVGGNGAALGLTLGGYAAGTGLALALLSRAYPHAQLGFCNLVTLGRMALAAALLAPLAGDAVPWAVIFVATVAFALDGVDDWLARREGHVSAFGARFDMEVDSALALILALNAWAAGTAGAVVLVIALPRYLFAAASSLLPWLAQATPDRFSRKAVCVLQIATLIALQWPPLAPISDPLILAVAAALAWSFGRDVLWLWRARP